MFVTLVIITYKPRQDIDQAYANLADLMYKSIISKYAPNKDIYVSHTTYIKRYPPKTKRFTLKTWREVLEMMSQNQLASLTCSTRKLDVDYREPHFDHTIHEREIYFDVTTYDQVGALHIPENLPDHLKNTPTYLRLFATHHYVDVNNPSWQNSWVALGIEAMRNTLGSYGHIVYDSQHFMSVTSYEYTRDVAYQVNYTSSLGGYSWGNFLNSQHVAKLGGIDSVIKNAPCYKVIPIKTEIGTGAFLQASENLLSMTDDELRRIRDYLCPLIPRCNEPLKPIIQPPPPIQPHRPPLEIRFKLIYDE